MTWEEFKETFGKSYNSVEEEAYRKSVFENNVKKMDKNNKSQNKKHLQEVTQFADMTHKEFKSMFLTAKFEKATKSRPEKEERSHNGNAKGKKRLLQSSYDINWYDEGGVTEIRNQGYCGPLLQVQLLKVVT